MSADIAQRIRARIGQGEFLASLLFVATRKSQDVQSDFVQKLASIATVVRKLLLDNGYILALPYRPAEYWPLQRGRAYGFIDGGVANIELPSAAPIGIRVGSYVVRPGEASDTRREQFNIELSIVDDLFSEEGYLYDIDFLDVAKLRDAARMTSETAAALRLAKVAAPPDVILVHGPLVNPVAPYGLEGFPSFGTEACRSFLSEASWTGDEKQRQFVPIYLDVLERLKATGVPVAGAVERSIGREPVVLKEILGELVDRRLLPREDAQKVEDDVRTYGLNDATLFDVALMEGEHTKPLPVNRQGPENKWPETWKYCIRTYPCPLTTYLKPAELVLPFRIETFDNVSDFRMIADLVLHTSRLLPTYGFPVGLDIVDKFAKVPAWMSRGVRGQYQVVLLQKALASGNPSAISFAKRVLATKGRDWLFRPQA
jgi:hypothetical protein